MLKPSTDLWTLLQLFTTVTIDEPAPGLKSILSFRVPDQRSGKVSYTLAPYTSVMSVSYLFLSFISTVAVRTSIPARLCGDNLKRWVDC